MPLHSKVNETLKGRRQTRARRMRRSFSEQAGQQEPSSSAEIESPPRPPPLNDQRGGSSDSFGFSYEGSNGYTIKNRECSGRSGAMPSFLPASARRLGESSVKFLQKDFTANYTGYSYTDSDCSLTTHNSSGKSYESISLSGSVAPPKRQVSFSTVEVREYAVTMDPKGRLRYSLTLDWQHTNGYRKELGSFEVSGDARRLSVSERRERLSDMEHDSVELTVEDVNAVLQGGDAIF